MRASAMRPPKTYRPDLADQYARCHLYLAVGEPAGVWMTEGAGMFTRVLGGTLTLLLAFGLGAVAPASASAESKPERKPKADRVVKVVFENAVADIAAPDLEVGTAAVAAAAVSCREITTTAIGQNAVGWDLYKFKQTSRWCFDGDRITSRSSDLSVSTHYPGWGWKGLVDYQANSSGVPYVVYRQGHFALCAPTPWGETCTSNGYPWVRHTMRKGGSYVIEHGSGV